MAVTEDFYYVEGNTSVRNLVKSLVDEITQKAGAYTWELVFPATVDAIGVKTTKTVNLINDGSTTSQAYQKIYNLDYYNDTCILKATTRFGKSFYLKIERGSRDLTVDEKTAIVSFNAYKNGSSLQRTDAITLDYFYTQPGSMNTFNNYVSAMTASQALNNLTLQIASQLNQDGNDIDISSDIQSKYNYRLSWYRNLQAGIGDYLPVQYWLNVTKDSINLILRGDPSADDSSYKSYLTSYAYIGALNPIEDGAIIDDVYNFGITVSSDIEPNYSNLYGSRTATGITDVCMIGNKVGMPYQSHYPSFYTTNPFMDKCNIEGSRWNHKKRNFSDITLVHSVDMERGKMINVLAGDASRINDTDKLTYNEGLDSEENYKKFKITAPFNFLNNSSNPNAAIAIRCYQTTK